MARFSWVDAEAAALGVKFRAAEVHGVRPAKRINELEHAKRAIVRQVRSTDLGGNQTLAGYRLLFERVGAVGFLSSPEALLQFALEKEKLPDINTVVDAYNVVSLTTLTVVSAHDLDRTDGNPRIEMTKGTEMFHPLRSDPITLPAGQWAGFADNHVLCQMNCKQSELSKVTSDTRNLLVYVQGNPNTTCDDIESVLRSVCEEIVRFNGGEAVYLESRDP